MAAATKMAIAGPGDDAKIVVCGPPGGIAGLIAGRLKAAGGIREVVLADETEILEQQVRDGAGVCGGAESCGLIGGVVPMFWMPLWLDR